MAPLAEERLGALPDPSDPRDYIRERISSFSPTVSLLTYGLRDALDQGTTQSCTGHAGTAFLANIYGRALGSSLGWTASPFWLYYKAREKSGMQGADGGAYLRDLMKTMQQDGAAPSTAHESRNPKTAPSEDSMKWARTMRIKEYQRILPLPTAPAVMMTTIAVERLPIIVGVQLYQSVNFPGVQTSGRIPVPVAGERAIGGHAMMIDGYDERAQLFFGFNSWGPDWGARGRFSLPFEYVSRPDLTSDIWTATYGYW